jgi:hypothetical protein
MRGGVSDAADLTSRLGDQAIVVTDAETLHAELLPPRDLLVISAHGDGAGPSWAVELDAGQRLSGGDIAELQLPSLVIAASCLSGRQSFEAWPPTFVTSCIANGVSSLVAGLWDLPDVAASQLVSGLTDSLIDTNWPVEVCLQFVRLHSPGPARPSANGLG